MQAFVTWWCHLIGVTDVGAIQTATGIVAASLLIVVAIAALSAALWIVALMLNGLSEGDANAKSPPLHRTPPGYVRHGGLAFQPDAGAVLRGSRAIGRHGPHPDSCRAAPARHPSHCG